LHAVYDLCGALTVWPPQISEEKRAALVAKKRKRKERKERRKELEARRLRRRDAPKPLREELVRAVRRLGEAVERERKRKDKVERRKKKLG
jgi:hypothetical protein